MTTIVISREFGSLGEEIAQATADALGLQYMNQEKIHQLAVECDPAFKEACSTYEREIPKGFFERFFFNHPAYASLFQALTYDLASQGDVVIMGRGAQIVLSGVPGVFKCRIVAPLETRVKRIAEERGMRLDEARAFVERYGRQRRSLIEGIFEKNLSDWTLYDMILNTEDTSVEEATEVIVHAVRTRKSLPLSAEVKEQMRCLAFAKRVESAVREALPRTPVGEVTADCDAMGRVTLRGMVHSTEQREKAERVAREVQDVLEIDNQLKPTAFHGWI